MVDGVALDADLGRDLGAGGPQAGEHIARIATREEGKTLAESDANLAAIPDAIPDAAPAIFGTSIQASACSRPMSRCGTKRTASSWNPARSSAFRNSSTLSYK